MIFKNYVLSQNNRVAKYAYKVPTKARAPSIIQQFSRHVLNWTRFLDRVQYVLNSKFPTQRPLIFCFIARFEFSSLCIYRGSYQTYVVRIFIVIFMYIFVATYL
jgi:hypothetical protein